MAGEHEDLLAELLRDSMRRLLDQIPEGQAQLTKLLSAMSETMERLVAIVGTSPSRSDLLDALESLPDIVEAKMREIVSGHERACDERGKERIGAHNQQMEMTHNRNTDHLIARFKDMIDATQAQQDLRTDAVKVAAEAATTKMTDLETKIDPLIAKAKTLYILVAVLLSVIAIAAAVTAIAVPFLVKALEMIPK